MQRLSGLNKLIIALIVCFMIVIAILFVISEFTVYRAETIDGQGKTEEKIVFMPFASYKSELNGVKHTGKYERKLTANGDYVIEFKDKSGCVAFTALYYGETLQIGGMRFRRTF